MNNLACNNISFKGFDNIFAAKQTSGNSGEYAITMRLNNLGENDLDRFEPVLNKKTNDNLLTIHYTNLEKGKYPNCPNGVSFVDINNFPLIIDKNELKNVNFAEIKEVEKASLSLAQNVANLLKRVAQNPEPKRDSSLATYTSMDKTIDSLCGMYKELPGFKEKAIQLIVGQVRREGDSNVIRDVAKVIEESITNKMIKYFK